MNRVLLDTTFHQTRIALVEDGKLAELSYEIEGEESLVGNIYAGRVETVLPGMQAVFVNIGKEKNGYLYYGEKRGTNDEMPKKNRPKVGDTVLVQVEKDAAGKKGMMLTKKLSFPGKFLVLLPGDMGNLGISRKIEEPKERERIKEVVGKLLPEGYGMIVRTNGKGKSELDFAEEMNRLLTTAKEMTEKGQFIKPPSLLHEESGSALKAVRDYFSKSTDEFVVNEKEMYALVQEEMNLVGETEIKLVLHQETTPLFESYFVESQAEKVLDKKVWLKSGGFLIIEETEACVVVDVNTGKFTGKGDFQKTILKTNLEAAIEVAFQLRLRNLSGMIIVDFIDMVSEDDRFLVRKELEKALKKDRTKTMVVGMTELGLMQITRKKTRPPLSKQITVSCKDCHGTGRLPSIDWIVGKMRREVISTFADTIYDHIKIEADPRLIYHFAGKDDIFLKEVAYKHQKIVICAPVENSGFGYYSTEKWKENQ